MNAFAAGINANSICENPFWTNYPKPSLYGEVDEISAREFVDGYVKKIQIINGATQDWPFRVTLNIDGTCRHLDLGPGFDGAPYCRDCGEQL